MGGIFSKKSKPPTPVQNCEITEADQAILQLKTQRDKMKQFVKRKEKCLDKERQLAKELLKEGKKDKALLLLKKKRFQENAIDQMLQQLNQIERMVNDLEFADIQQRVVEGLRKGNDALKRLNSILDIDEVEKIMDETKESAEYQAEISSLISGQLSATDIGDVERELDELLAAEAGEKLPEVPTSELPEVEEEAEEGEKIKEKPQKKREPALVA